LEAIDIFGVYVCHNNVYWLQQTFIGSCYAQSLFLLSTQFKIRVSSQVQLETLSYLFIYLTYIYTYIVVRYI